MKQGYMVIDLQLDEDMFLQQNEHVDVIKEEDKTVTILYQGKEIELDKRTIQIIN